MAAVVLGLTAKNRTGSGEYALFIASPGRERGQGRDFSMGRFKLLSHCPTKPALWLSVRYGSLQSPFQSSVSPEMPKRISIITWCARCTWEWLLRKFRWMNVLLQVFTYRTASRTIKCEMYSSSNILHLPPCIHSIACRLCQAPCRFLHLSFYNEKQPENSIQY